jgi:hypothetical protein
MGRTDKHGLCLVRQYDVVAKAASAGQQAKILLATDRLTDAVRHSIRGLHALPWFVASAERDAVSVSADALFYQYQMRS